MANLKDIVATLAILSAGTLTLTGCKDSGGETTNPDEVQADDAAGEGDAADAAAEGEGSCAGEDAAAEGEGSCGGEDAAEGEGSCGGEDAAAEE